MLIDQFTLNGYMEASLGCAPLFTVAFLPGGFQAGLPQALGRAHKEGVPFFCTDYEKPIGAPEVMRLGLSASDF